MMVGHLVLRQGSLCSFVTATAAAAATAAADADADADAMIFPPTEIMERAVA